MAFKRNVKETGVGSSRCLAAILGSLLVVVAAPGGTAQAAYPGDDGRIVVTVDGRPDRLLPHSGRVFLDPSWQPS